VRVESAELEMDEPLRIARNDLSLDLAGARLGIVDGRPFLVRIEGAHNVVARGGSIQSGAWGVLVIGSTHVTLRDMDIAGLLGGGFFITGSEDINVWSNRLHELGGAPVLIMGKTDRVTVAQNQIFANRGPSNWNAGIVMTDRNTAPGDPSQLLPVAHFWPSAQPMSQRSDIPHDNVIAENRIAGNLSSGIYSDGSAGNLIIATGSRLTRKKVYVSTTARSLMSLRGILFSEMASAGE
jgi:hypothetical protein